MKNKSSTIPAKAQIPMAIVLAILFAIILYWRFGPEEATPDVSVILEEEPTSLQFYAEDLRVILNQLSQIDTTETSEASDRVAINNPFAIREEAIVLIHGGGTPVPSAIIEPTLLTPDARRRRVELLALTATFLSSDRNAAMVNGEIVTLGESILGFRIVSIVENHVILEDAVGTVQLNLEEDAIQ